MAEGQFTVGAQLVGTQEVLESLRNLALGGQRMRPLMKRIGERIIVPSFRETLATGGRGAWPAERRPVRKHRMLGAEGRIAKGLKVIATDTSVRVGSTSGFSTWAQFGFRATIRAEAPRKRRALRLFTPGGVRFARSVRAHTTVVPPRPWLVLTAEDEAAIVAEVAKTLDRLARREAKAGDA